MSCFGVSVELRRGYGIYFLLFQFKIDRDGVSTLDKLDEVGGGWRKHSVVCSLHE